jgi:hypothetical protein
MKKYLIAIAVIVSLTASESAQITSQQQRMKDCTRRQAAWLATPASSLWVLASADPPPKPRGQIAQKEAVRQFLHRPAGGVNAIAGRRFDGRPETQPRAILCFGYWFRPGCAAETSY